MIDKRLTATEKKKIKPVKQGGGMNYLGKQETVTVPKKWLSDPDHVVAELAYITPREQKILLDANIYGSLDGKPNKGPGGIMSLQGDMGSVGGGSSSGGNGDKGSSNRERGIMSRGKGPKGTTGNIGGFTDTGPDRSAVNQFSQYGKNVMAQNLQSLAPNPLERGLELYNKYGLIPNAARVVGNIFGGIFGGSPKGFSTQGDPYGNAPGGLRDYSDPGPTDDRDGGDGNRNLYATTNQYTAPTFVEEDEEGITTMVNNPDFIQRFMVKEPYRQAQGLDFLAQNQAIANMINNLYT